MIHESHGNLLDSDAEALVNTVNTVGVMGKGIALQFRRRFPDMFEPTSRPPSGARSASVRCTSGTPVR
ncbi:MAG: macro domain-containing protein [Pseudonocardiaceae bacterium]